MRVLGLLVGLTVLAFASPASADDWTLKCDYKGGLKIFASYKAGDPSYEIYVSSSGDSDLGRDQRFSMNELLSPDETILFTQKDGPVQILFRVVRETLATTIEIGSQASWDYKKTVGVCSVAQQ